MSDRRQYPVLWSLISFIAFVAGNAAEGKLHLCTLTTVMREFAADMPPTGGFTDPVVCKQFVEAGIAIGMDDAGELLQVGSRMLAFAVGRVAEKGGRGWLVVFTPFVRADPRASLLWAHQGARDQNAPVPQTYRPVSLGIGTTWWAHLCRLRRE
jgi:hypothetical protein